jgi:hypothetical protein
LGKLWSGVELARLDVTNGKTRDARELSRTQRNRFGLAWLAVLVVTDESFSLVKIVWIKSSRNRALVAVYF